MMHFLLSSMIHFSLSNMIHFYRVRGFVKLKKKKIREKIGGGSVGEAPNRI